MKLITLVMSLHSVLHNVKTAAILIVQQLFYIQLRKYHSKVWNPFNLRYSVVVDNILQGGDHVSWHSPLDQTESRIQHMLMAEDAQLSPVQSPFGYVNFIQIVGVCAEELKAAQHWNGPGVLELLRNIPR